MWVWKKAGNTANLEDIGEEGNRPVSVHDVRRRSVLEATYTAPRCPSRPSGTSPVSHRAQKRWSKKNREEKYFDCFTMLHSYLKSDCTDDLLVEISCYRRTATLEDAGAFSWLWIEWTTNGNKFYRLSAKIEIHMAASTAALHLLKSVPQKL